MFVMKLIDFYIFLNSITNKTRQKNRYSAAIAYTIKLLVTNHLNFIKMKKVITTVIGLALVGQALAKELA